MANIQSKTTARRAEPNRPPTFAQELAARPNRRRRREETLASFYFSKEMNESRDLGSYKIGFLNGLLKSGRSRFIDNDFFVRYRNSIFYIRILERVRVYAGGRWGEEGGGGVSIKRQDTTFEA